jgi:hypothetical protein
MAAVFPCLGLNQTVETTMFGNIGKAQSGSDKQPKAVSYHQNTGCCQTIQNHLNHRHRPSELLREPSMSLINERHSGISKGSSLSTLRVHRSVRNLISVAERQHMIDLGRYCMKYNGLGGVLLVSRVVYIPHLRDKESETIDLLGLHRLSIASLEAELLPLCNTMCCFCRQKGFFIESSRI